MWGCDAAGRGSTDGCYRSEHEECCLMGPRGCRQAPVYAGFLLPRIVCDGTFVFGLIGVRISDARGLPTAARGRSRRQPWEGRRSRPRSRACRRNSTVVRRLQESLRVETRILAAEVPGHAFLETRRRSLFTENLCDRHEVTLRDLGELACLGKSASARCHVRPHRHRRRPAVRGGSLSSWSPSLTSSMSSSRSSAARPRPVSSTAKVSSIVRR